MRAAVLGAGSWGTALALLLARNGADVHLIGRDHEEIASIRSVRENLRYLPGFRLPESVDVVLTDQAPEAVDLAVIAVPVNSIRELLHHSSLHPLLRSAPVVLASKGLEVSSGLVPTSVATSELPGLAVGAVSGPNLAVEVARGIPTAAVVAFEDADTAESVRLAFNCSSFRAYRTTDLIGIELAGALKNVIAIAAGMSDGLGFGDNTKGALVARGLREILEIGQSLGGRTETFLGIAGVGDLFATASSQLSRNYRVGRCLSQGKSLEETLDEIGQAAEGIYTSEAVSRICREKRLELPIFDGVNLVIQGRIDAKTGLRMLMDRSTPDERVSLRSALH